MVIPEFCVVILVLVIGLPILFRLLKALGPIVAILIGIALAVGVVVLAANLVGLLIETSVELLFGPVGIALVVGGLAYAGYRRWQRSQLPPGVVASDEKRKRTGSSTRLEVGDDGEIVTLDELLDEDGGEKKKRR